MTLSMSLKDVPWSPGDKCERWVPSTHRAILEWYVVIFSTILAWYFTKTPKSDLAGLGHSISSTVLEDYEAWDSRDITPNCPFPLSIQHLSASQPLVQSLRLRRPQLYPGRILTRVESLLSAHLEY